MRKPYQICLPILLIYLVPAVATAQSFRVQCPTSTITHPAALNNNNVEPPYTAPTVLTAPSATTFQAPSANVNGAIKCQQASGGDGYAELAGGTRKGPARPGLPQQLQYRESRHTPAPAG